MTEIEWLTCECPLPMLIFLRGPVGEEEKQPPAIHSNHGVLWCGSGQAITAEQCRLFVLQCSCRLCELDLDAPSRDALVAYGRYVLEDAPWQEFADACQRIHTARLGGGPTVLNHMAAMWDDDPLGAATAASDIAVAMAYAKAQDSIAVTCSNATEDDWFSYSFSGPPDPLWEATRASEEKFQAQVLREIVGNPFQL